MSNSIPAQSGSISPITPTGSNFWGQVVTINANQTINRTYDSTLNRGTIDVVDGVLHIYENGELVRRVVRDRRYEVAIGDANTFAAGDEKVRFVETYRK